MEQNENTNTSESVDDVSRLCEEVKKMEGNLETIKKMLADADNCKMEVTRSALVKVCTAYWNKWFRTPNG